MLDVIARVAGCRHLVVCPLYVSGRIVASIGYAMPTVPTAEKQVICEAFSRQASMTLERAEQARILRQQNEELLRFRTQALQAEQARLWRGDRPSTYVLLELRLDPSARQVTWSGRPVPLSPREYALLQALMEQRGRALSREEIVQRVWGFVPERDSNLVDMTMVALRRKLADSGAPPLIRAVRGYGYAIRDEGATET
jgi:DNA-binding response OmpR family regulator